MVKTNQGAKKVLFPNIAFSKLNNVFCEIMRASILCNLNFVDNKYFAVTFVSLPKVVLQNESSLMEAAWPSMEAAWPNGQRVGLAIRRSRVRVPL